MPKPDARFVLCTGYDFEPGSSIPYTTNLPLARAVEDDVLLVHTWEGEPLPREHGGPCRMITPKLYAWKGTKWIRKIEFLAGGPRGLLGGPRLLEQRRAVVQRSVFEYVPGFQGSRVPRFGRVPARELVLTAGNIDSRSRLREHE